MRGEQEKEKNKKKKDIKGREQNSTKKWEFERKMRNSDSYNRWTEDKGRVK